MEKINEYIQIWQIYVEWQRDICYNGCRKSWGENPGMRKRNVCKFSTLTQSHSLEIRCFVLETDHAVMAQRVQLKCSRVYLLTQGEGELHADGSVTHVRPGMLVFGFEREWISIVPDGNCAYMYIDFSGLRAQELMLRFGIDARNRSFFGLDGMIPLWNESLLRASRETVDLAAESMLLFSFSRLTDSRIHRGELISRILMTIDERFTDTGFSVTALAQELGYSPKYISSVIKRKTGTGFSEYLQKKRIAYAVSLFDHGLDSVKNVAFLSGYADPLYFSTAFKKHTGISPREYCNRVVNANTDSD